MKNSPLYLFRGHIGHRLLCLLSLSLTHTLIFVWRPGYESSGTLSAPLILSFFAVVVMDTLRDSGPMNWTTYPDDGPSGAQHPTVRGVAPLFPLNDHCYRSVKLMILMPYNIHTNPL